MFLNSLTNKNKKEDNNRSSRHSSKYTCGIEQNICSFHEYKSFNDVSAQRIEMHPSTYHYLNNEVEKILNMIIYLMFENGDKRNPQVRPIAIAEKYARETRKYSNVQKLMKESGLIPTMNEGRGFN